MTTLHNSQTLRRGADLLRHHSMGTTHHVALADSHHLLLSPRCPPEPAERTAFALLNSATTPEPRPYSSSFSLSQSRDLRVLYVDRHLLNVAASRDEAAHARRALERDATRLHQRPCRAEGVFSGRVEAQPCYACNTFVLPIFIAFFFPRFSWSLPVFPCSRTHRSLSTIAHGKPPFF